MDRRRRMLVGALGVAIALVAGAVAGGAIGRATAGKGGGEACGDAGGKTKEIAAAKLIIEFNASDEDIGVHGLFEDDGWSTLCVFDPSGRRILQVGPRSELADLTMAGIFFESREPPLDEFGFAELKALFPEGEYTVRGASFDGKTLEGKAIFTHGVPAEPEISAPDLAEEPEQAGPVPLEGLVVDWEPVTQTVDGGSLELTGYEVIVTKEEHDDPNGFSQPIYDVHVLPGVTRLPVPTEFLEPDTLYELEVLALEASGNQTISVGFFRTA